MDNQQPSINNSLFYQIPKTGYGYIYKYTSPSGKSYIGQTSGSLKSRAKNLCSGNGYKKCSLFWKAIQKYGWLNFQVEILEEVPIEQLNEREQYYIDFFQTCGQRGYNLTNGGEGGKKKEVYVYDVQTGNFIEHYNSITEASCFLNIPIETISAILSEKSSRKMAHGLTFSTVFYKKIDVSLLVRANYCEISYYDKDGYYIGTSSTIREAAKVCGVSEGQVRKCLNGLNTHASWIQFTRYKKDKINSIPKNSKTPVPVCQIDPNTQEIIAFYPSLVAAAKGVGLSSSSGIKKVIERGKGLSGGYFWKVDEGSTTKCEENPTSTARDILL